MNRHTYAVSGLAVGKDFLRGWIRTEAYSHIVPGRNISIHSSDKRMIVFFPFSVFYIMNRICVHRRNFSSVTEPVMLLVLIPQLFILSNNIRHGFIYFFIAFSFCIFRIRTYLFRFGFFNISRIRYYTVSYLFPYCIYCHLYRTYYSSCRQYR